MGRLHSNEMYRNTFQWSKNEHDGRKIGLKRRNPFRGSDSGQSASVAQGLSVSASDCSTKADDIGGNAGLDSAPDAPRSCRKSRVFYR